MVKTSGGEKPPPEPGIVNCNIMHGRAIRIAVQAAGNDGSQMRAVDIRGCQIDTQIVIPHSLRGWDEIIACNID